MDDLSKCPVMHGSATSNSGKSTSNRDWWLNQLNLNILHQNDKRSNPMSNAFSYKDAFKKLDYFALKKDLHDLMTDSQKWWPADYGHYGPFFIRMTGMQLVLIVLETVEVVEVLALKDLLH